MDEKALLDAAVAARTQAEDMTAVQLDRWHESVFGVSLVANDPGMQPATLTAEAARLMFFLSLPDGVKTIGAEKVALRLVASIKHGIDL